MALRCQYCLPNLRLSVRFFFTVSCLFFSSFPSSFFRVSFLFSDFPFPFFQSSLLVLFQSFHSWRSSSSFSGFFLLFFRGLLFFFSRVSLLFFTNFTSSFFSEFPSVFSVSFLFFFQPFLSLFKIRRKQYNLTWFQF